MSIKNRIMEYMDAADHVEKECKKVEKEETKWELVHSLKEEVHKSHTEKKELVDKLALERTTAESFLTCEAGRNILLI